MVLWCVMCVCYVCVHVMLCVVYAFMCGVTGLVVLCGVCVTHVFVYGVLKYVCDINDEFIS